ncbi:MAG: hypothetical protein C0631_02305 [Sedimenticola sp.]|nr:MAG: hypothetical protein C0631_02305 [Sedimenticola sp.]
MSKKRPLAGRFFCQQLCNRWDYYRTKHVGYVRRQISASDPLPVVVDTELFYSRYIKNLLPIILLLVFVTAHASVYKWVDEKGEVHFSDQPEAGAEQIELSEPTIYTPPDAIRSQPYFDRDQGRPSISQQRPSGYQELLITSPANEESIRSNEGSVSVTLQLSPALLPGNKFRVYMDGEEISSGLTTTSIQLMNVDRGTHLLYAIVVDGSGKELIRSNEVTFTIHKISVLTKPKPNNSSN